MDADQWRTVGSLPAYAGYLLTLSRLLRLCVGFVTIGSVV